MQYLNSTFLIVSLYFLSCFNIYGQPPCENNFPISLSNIPPICADDPETSTTISFSLTNTTSNAGEYIVFFPDGIDTVLTNFSGTEIINYEMNFACDNMPGNPIAPNASNHFFEYQILVQRTDCSVDGIIPQVSSILQVVPNPIQPFSFSDTDCISSPFLVTFSSNICNRDLVETYSWFVDDELVLESTGEAAEDLEDYLFSGPGTYSIKLEVTDYFDCGPYSYEEEVTITAEPSIAVSLNIDSSDLCQSVIEITTSNNSLYSDSFNWSSSSTNVSFSDPSATNPVITINNTMPDTYVITLEAFNADCDSVLEDFEITTFNEQTITINLPLLTCTQSQINLCDFIEFMPTPLSVNWSPSEMGISITNADSFCPLITSSISGDFSINATGNDICGNPFSIDIPISITPSEEVVFNLSAIDTLCENEMPVDLLNYIVPSDYIVSCTGNGVSNCEFDPMGNTGMNTITLIDTCGANYDIDIFVTALGDFQGGDLAVCIGDSINLSQIQSGSYSGNGVINNVFYSSLAGVDDHTISFDGTASFCGGTGQFQISVVDIPVAGFDVINTSCRLDLLVFPEGEIIEVNNTSDASTICYTVLETNQEFCGNDSATFLFNDSGEYTIQQIVEVPVGGCQDTITETILIESAYTPVITSVADTTDCDSVTVSFLVDTTISTYQYIWTFENGITSNISNPILTVERPFISSPFLAELDIITYCDTLSFEVEQELPALFQVSFGIINDNNTICSGETAYFQNTSSNYDSLSITYNTDNVSSMFLDSLIYNNTSDTIAYIEIVLEGFREGCPSLRAVDTLTVLPINTIAEFSLSWDDTSCSPFLVRLMNNSTVGAHDLVYWGDNSTPQQVGSLQEIEQEFFVDTDTTIWITLISELCGKDTMRRSITVYSSPEFDFDYFPINSQCENDSISFIPFGDIGPDFDLDWDFGDGTTSNLVDPTHSYITAGLYNVTLTVTDTNSCMSAYSLPIEIYEYTGVDLEVSAPNIVCENEIFDLNIISSEGDIWIDYDSELVASEPVSVPYLEEGEYILSISTTDNNGCSQDTSILVNVKPSIEVSIIPNVIDTVLELGDEIQLDFLTTPVRSIDNIEWLGDLVSTPDRRITTVLPSDDGYYYLSIEDEYGCRARDSIFVWVNKSYDERIFIPNVFSPNDDGVNDKFYIFSKSNTVLIINSFQVFSRWGEVLFEYPGPDSDLDDCLPNNSDCGWDGKFKGKTLDPGVFVWLAEIQFTDGETRLFKGSVTLVK